VRRREWVPNSLGSDIADPIRHQTRVLSGRDAETHSGAAGEQKFPRRLVGAADVVVNRLASLLSQFEPDRAAGLFLAYRCPVNRVPARGAVLDPEGDNITTAQLAVNCQIKHCQVAGAALDLKFGSDGPDMLGPQGRFCADQVAFVPRDPGLS